MTRTKSSRALLSVVLAVLMVAAFMPALTYSSFAATAKKATKVTKTTHNGTRVYGKVGKKYVLKYKLSPSKLTSAAKKVTWKSSDSSVVKVYSKNTNRAAVKALKAGTAKVTVYTKANKKAKATWKFKVTEAKKTTELTGVTVTAKNTTTAPAKAVTVGETLTATVAPADAENVTYQWYADGTAIDGATSADFTVSAAQSGKAITVKATSKNEVTSAATAKVNTQTLSTATLKSVDANGKDAALASPLYVGDTVKAVATGSETDGTTTTNNVTINDVTYQWYRVVNGTNTAISGATSQTYTLTDADKTYTVFCVVTPNTGVKGYAVKSDATSAVQAATSNTLSIKVEDGTLTAVTKAADGTTVTPASYQWAESKDGTTFTALSGSTASTLKTLTAGNTYKVTITPAAGQKFASTSATVKYTGKFLNKTNYSLAAVEDTTNTSSTAPVKGDVLAVKNLTGLTYGTDYTITWYRTATGSKALDTLTAKNLGTSQTYTVTSDDASSDIYAVVTGAGDYAGQTMTLDKVTTAAANSTTAAQLTYKDGAFTVPTGYNLYKVSNADVTKTTGITATAVTNTTVSAAQAEGWTYFAVKDGKATNGVQFTTGATTPNTSVAISDYVVKAATATADAATK